MGLLMRRRPLLRAAAVSGGAYMMGKRHAEGQEPQYGQEGVGSQQYAAPAPAPAGPGISDATIGQLKELGSLRESGVLTDQEFDQQKAKLLAG